MHAQQLRPTVNRLLLESGSTLISLFPASCCNNSIAVCSLWPKGLPSSQSSVVQLNFHSDKFRDNVPVRNHNRRHNFYHLIMNWIPVWNCGQSPTIYAYCTPLSLQNFFGETSVVLAMSHHHSILFTDVLC